MSASTDKPLLLITGSSGLLGTAVQERLIDKFRIVGLDIEEPDQKPEAAEWKQCDLTDDAHTQTVLSDIRETHGDELAGVIHLAAYYDFSGEPSPMYEELTVEGTRRLIMGLQEFSSVDRFIFSSSLLVMRPAEENEEILTETSPTEGDWDYPESKLEAEEVLRDKHDDIPVTILRIAGVYDDQCSSIPISQHIRRIYEKELESYVFPGDSDHGQPFIHIEDLVDCFEQTMLQRKELADFDKFLVAEPEVLSHADLQESIGLLIHGKEWPALRIPKPAAKAGAWVKEQLPWEDPFIKAWMVDLADDHYPVEIEKARKELQWEPNHRLNDTLEKMIDFLKDNPERFYQKHHLNGNGDDE